MSPIVGRRRELERIEAAVRGGLGGDGALVLLSGEAGIGKTLLSDHAASCAARSGATIAWGRCWEAGGAPAYWPWIEVFRALGEDADPFFPSESGESPADARFRSFDLVVRRLTGAARQRPLAILLDDLHAADVPSLLVLSLLVRGLRGIPIVVVGTYRDAEARRHGEIGQLIAKIAREGEVVPLEPLEAEDVAEWLRREGGDITRAEEVYRLTEGNPLFVQEILRLGDARRPARLPDGLSAVLDEHLARVSTETRAVLECGAVLGREFVPAYAARLAGVDAAAASIALAEAENAALVSSAPNGRRTFIHMLVRDRLVEKLAPARHAELHCRAGEAILAARVDFVSAAHHFIEGHTAARIERVLEVARDAAERALSSLAFEDAAELGERALALVSDCAPTHQSCALAVVVAEAHLRAGALTVGKERCVESARIAKALGASDLLARAALAYGAHFATATVDRTMVALLEDAFSALEEHDHPNRARVMARLAAALVPPRTEDVPRVLSLGKAAVAMARRLGDAETLLYVLLYAGAALGYQVSVEERSALQEEIEKLARETGNRSTLVITLAFRAALLLESGRRAEADAMYAEYEELLSQFPQPAYQWRKYAGRAVFAALEGDFDAALRAGEEMRRHAEMGGAPTARIAWALLQVALAHATGDPSSIATRAESVLDVTTKVPTLLPYTAWVLAAIGRISEAREMLRRVSADIQGFPWLIVAGDAAAILGDQELAGRFYGPLSAHQFSNRIFWGPGAAFCLGPTPRTLGNLAMILGRPGDALRHYDEAIVVSERVGSKPLLALSRAGKDSALCALSQDRRTNAEPSSRRSDVGPAARPDAAQRSRGITLRRDGDVWAVEEEGRPTLRLKDGKGLRYLERLLSTPLREVHVLELAGIDEAPADAGSVLDAKAKDQYKSRIEDLENDLEEAMRHCDTGRAERARAEIDAIAGELASAVGLGGRDRKAASNVERARVNVQRRLRDAIERIAELDPGLGSYLSASIRTGTYCSFSPP